MKHQPGFAIFRIGILRVYRRGGFCILTFFKGFYLK